MRVMWLPDVLRAAGLQVDVYPGWETRGSDSWGPVKGVICHATAGSPNSTDAGEMRVLWVTGSPTAPAHIAQCYLSRSGRWTVGASGRCNHVKFSDVRPWPAIGNYGNGNLIGVEAQNDNRGQPWPADQIIAYTRGVAAILAHLRMTEQQAAAHREHQTGKSDPFGIDMVAFRREVALHMGGSAVASDLDQFVPPDGGVRQNTFMAYHLARALMGMNDPAHGKWGDTDEPEPNALAAFLREMAADVKALVDRPPVDPAELAAALAADPAFVAALADALEGVITTHGHDATFDLPAAVAHVTTGPPVAIGQDSTAGGSPEDPAPGQ